MEPIPALTAELHEISLSSYSTATDNNLVHDGEDINNDSNHKANAEVTRPRFRRGRSLNRNNNNNASPFRTIRKRLLTEDTIPVKNTIEQLFHRTFTSSSWQRSSSHSSPPNSSSSNCSFKMELENPDATPYVMTDENPFEEENERNNNNDNTEQISPINTSNARSILQRLEVQVRENNNIHNNDDNSTVSSISNDSARRLRTESAAVMDWQEWNKPPPVEIYVRRSKSVDTFASELTPNAIMQLEAAKKELESWQEDWLADAPPPPLLTTNQTHLQHLQQNETLETELEDDYEYDNESFRMLPPMQHQYDHHPRPPPVVAVTQSPEETMHRPRAPRNIPNDNRIITPIHANSERTLEASNCKVNKGSLGKSISAPRNLYISSSYLNTAPRNEGIIESADQDKTQCYHRYHHQGLTKNDDVFVQKLLSTPKSDLHRVNTDTTAPTVGTTSPGNNGTLRSTMRRPTIIHERASTTNTMNRIVFKKERDNIKKELNDTPTTVAETINNANVIMNNNDNSYNCGDTISVSSSSSLLGDRPRRRMVRGSPSVFSFGSIVGQSSLRTPTSHTSPLSMSSSLVDRRQSTSSSNQFSQLVKANRKLKQHVDTEYVSEEFFHIRQKSAIQQDLEFIWNKVSKPVKRWTGNEEKQIDLCRNQKGCLT